jgi:hypothetical protein
MPRLLLALPLALVLPTAARPDEAADLKDRVLKAAARDPAGIQKFKLFTLKAKGKSRVTGTETPADFDLAAVYPGKLKATWEFGAGAGKQFVTMCASDDRGWRQGTNFPPTDLSVEELNDFRSDAYGLFASTLLPLTEKETKVSLGGRAKVGEDPVVSLKLVRRPYPEVTLSFDEKTLLLRKMGYRSRENGRLMLKEMVYSNHQTVGGLALPATQTTYVDGGEKFTWTEMTFAFPDNLNIKTFEKP